MTVRVPCSLLRLSLQLRFRFHLELCSDSSSVDFHLQATTFLLFFDSSLYHAEMAKFTVTLVLALFALATNAAPLERRVAQAITDATQRWEEACVSPHPYPFLLWNTLTDMNIIMSRPTPVEAIDAGTSLPLHPTHSSQRPNPAINRTQRTR